MTEHFSMMVAVTSTRSEHTPQGGNSFHEIHALPSTAHHQSHLRSVFSVSVHADAPLKSHLPPDTIFWASVSAVPAVVLSIALM